jgi:hypothetical protein
LGVARHRSAFKQATSLHARVFDRVGRSHQIDVILKGFRVILGTIAAVPYRGATKEDGRFPDVTQDYDMAACVVGLLLQRVGAAAAEPVLDVGSALYVVEVAGRIRSAFDAMRAQAERRGERDILRQFEAPDDCRVFLRRFGGSGEVDAGRPGGSGAAHVSVVSAGLYDDRWSLLTWNLSAAFDVGGDGWKSVQAPAIWTQEEQLDLQVAELRRWKAHLFAVQECVGESTLRGLSGHYALVGVVRSHCGFTHLYARPMLGVQFHAVLKDHGVLVARATVGSVEVAFAAGHLEPGPAAEAVQRRRDAVAAVVGCVAEFRAVVFLGDLNVRHEEVHAWRESFRLRDAMYDGLSWNPSKMQFHADCHDKGRGMNFDRILFRGDTSVVAYLVGDVKIHAGGARFALSDHAAVFGYLDVHPCFGQSGLVGKANADKRRAALMQLRNQACLAERVFVAERDHRDRETAVLQRDEAAQRSLADVLARARAEAEVRRARRKSLLDSISGEGNLFLGEDSNVLSQVSLPADVAVPGCDSLQTDGAPVLWALLLRGYPALAGLADPGRLWGYAIAVYQFLARLPAVAVWLERHELDAAGGVCGDRCIVCLFQDVRVSLGKSALPRFFRLGPLSGVRDDIGTAASGDVVEYVVALLSKFAAVETALGRVGVSVGHCVQDAGGLTHVERVFGFPMDVRRRCKRCGVRREVVTSTCFALPSSDGTSTSELCLRALAPVAVTDVCVKCGAAVDVIQKRVLAWPNVLLLTGCA